MAERLVWFRNTHGADCIFVTRPTVIVPYFSRLGARPVHTRSEKVALVIGGTGALGGAVAARLASDSHAVAFTYRKNEERASELKAGIQSQGAISFAGTPDISDADAIGLFVADVVAHFGRLDTLVYAAGPSFSLDFVSNVSPDEWRRVLDADLNGCFNVIHACLPHLRSSSGSIVAVTAAGIERAIARDILSLAPKAAMTALVRGVAFEEGRNGVRANCVAPGYIAGGIGKTIMDSVGADVSKMLIGKVPLRRMGTCDEIADAVEFLCSSRASYITGTTLFVSGGMEL